MPRLFPLICVGLIAALAGCGAPVAPGGNAPHLSPEQAASSFFDVVARVEPVAEDQCRQRTVGVNCDFEIEVDGNLRAAPNAFQSVNDAGQPVIIFTVAMIADAENADELAFVLGHETAHHILGHLSRQARNADAGADVFAEMATKNGGTARDVAQAREIGAEIGARVYSKTFELEADELGTIIALRAGYDPLRGAGFFTRLPDPGDRFLGSHPPNAERLAVVRATVRRMGPAG